MKYLYIPTTTLNFNNILSTGSISPAAVYSERRFGYNKFELVPPNPFQNLLLLYNRYPIFSIVDPDRDNHPLVIRIRANRLFDENQTVRDISHYDKTIYLDPASTEFFFTTHAAREIALTKAEPSLTTKLIGLYQPRMQIANPVRLDLLEWHPGILSGVSEGTIEAALRNCENDKRINRMKGFACGYILGAYITIDEKVARFRSVLKDQRNEISAMLNDPTRRNSDALRLALESCFALDKFWTREGIGNRRFDHERGDKIINDRGQINALIDRHESDPQSTLLLRRLFNTFCITSEFGGPLDEVRFDVALEGARAIKNLMGNNWENSPNQTYINDLLNNIKSGSPFEFNSSNSLIMKSFAAFMLKGDDLEKLETYLVDQGVGDFRIAFALWGAMFGFSKIPKTIYNLADQRGEHTYTKKMHNYIHSTVHGTPLGDLEEIITHPKPQVGSVANSVSEPPSELIEKFQQQFSHAAHWSEKIAELLKKCGGNYKNFIKVLNKLTIDELGGKTKNGPRKIEVIRFFENALKSQPELSEQQLLLNEQNTLKFWNDPQAWEIIKQAVPSEYNNDIKTDLKWFQKEWIDPNSNYYGWQNEKAKSQIKSKKLEQRTSYDAILYFIKFLNSTRKRRLDEKREFLTESVINTISSLLYNKYC